MAIRLTQVAEPMLHRAAWPLWLGLLAAAAVLAISLGGCGTSISFEGQVCGEPVTLKLNDVKDRSTFDATATCPGGGGLTITTSESSYSAVLTQQAALIDRLATMLTRFLPPVPPASYGLPPRRDGMADAALARQVRGTVP